MTCFINYFDLEGVKYYESEYENEQQSQWSNDDYSFVSETEAEITQSLKENQKELETKAENDSSTTPESLTKLSSITIYKHSSN